MKRIPAALVNKMRDVAAPVTPSQSVWMASSADASIGDPHATALVFGSRARYVSPAELNYELPTSGHPEVAFAGRSNVGKSSLIGTLLRDPQLCRRSKRPGCTTSVNFFAPQGHLPSFVVDLPGFGFAERNQKHQEQWSRAMLDYLSARDRSTLRHAVLLVDARRGLTANQKDLEAIDAFSAMRVSHHVVLTKADLVKPPDLASSIYDTFTHLRRVRRDSSCIPVVHVVSAKLNFGIQHLRDFIAAYVADAHAIRRRSSTSAELAS